MGRQFGNERRNADLEKLAVAVINHKGGVGKTTLSLILTQMVLMKRHRVLAVDLDPQRNFTDALSFIRGYFKESLRVKGALAPEDAEAPEDWIVLDCPPSLGSISRVALNFSDIALVPVRPDLFSLSNLGVLYSVARECGKDRSQLPLVKVGYDATRLAQMAEEVIAGERYPAAASLPLNRLIPYNIASGRIWSTGLSAEARAPYERMFARLVTAYQRMLEGNFSTAWQ